LGRCGWFFILARAGRCGIRRRKLKRIIPIPDRFYNGQAPTLFTDYRFPFSHQGDGLVYKPTGPELAGLQTMSRLANRAMVPLSSEAVLGPQVASLPGLKILKVDLAKRTITVQSQGEK
jgi:hypothetical protein